MTQITHGIRAVLSHPLVYSSFQSLMGARSGTQRFVKNYIRPFHGMKILDIGCGPAEILAYLSDVEYWGFDISEAYIAQARNKFGGLGTFQRKELEREDLVDLPQFDVVLAMGLLHHLADPVVKNVMDLSATSLKPGGRLITIDPCLVSGQNPIARFLIRHDRGQNVRDRNGYETLAKETFSSIRIDVRHQAWIPYTHCIMECVKVM